MTSYARNINLLDCFGFFVYSHSLNRTDFVTQWHKLRLIEIAVQIEKWL